MSYFADHLAWQQRVNQEFKANCHYQDAEGSEKSQMRYSQYPDMINYMMLQQKATKKEKRESVKKNDKMTFEEMMQTGRQALAQKEMNGAFYNSQRGHMEQSLGMQGVLNTGNYGYAPKGRVLSSRQRLQSAGASSKRSQYSMQSHPKQQQQQQQQQPRARQLDAISYASRFSTKSANRVRGLGNADARRQLAAYSSQNTLPQKQDRFNEDFDGKSTVSKNSKTEAMMSSKNLANFTKGRPSLKVIGTPQLNATKQSEVGSQLSDKKSIFSMHSRMQMRRKTDADGKSNATSIRVRKSTNADQHKRRIFDVVNQLNEDELEKVSEMLRVSEALDKNDPAILTNDIDGEVCLGEDEGQDYEEAGDQVDELVSRVSAIVQFDDQLTSVSRQSSSKSMVASLSKQLQEEKEARKKLEGELHQLHKVSTEIHKKLTEKAQ